MNKLGKEILKVLDRDRERKVSWLNNKGKYLGWVPLSILGLEVYPVIWSRSKDPENIVKKIRDEITSLKKEGYIATLFFTTSDVLDSLKRYYKKKGDTVPGISKIFLLLQNLFLKVF